MIEFRFSAADLAETRLAVSPLWELVCSLRVLQAPSADAVYLPWTTEVRDKVMRLSDTPLLMALVPPGTYLPDFLTPPPSTPLPDLNAEIASMEAATPKQVRRDLARAYPQGLPALLHPIARDPTAGVHRIATALRRYWDCALADSWPAVRDVLERDIVHRAREFATGGASRLIMDLHPTVTWDGEQLSVEKQCSIRLDLGGAGLLLLPSAFAWPSILTIIDPQLQPTLIYPARGVATLWSLSDEAPANHGLARLIGPARATLLLMLGGPATTTDLARRTAMTAGGVSQHLARLREAGLVRGSRSGRVVLYARTPLGETLATSLG